MSIPSFHFALLAFIYWQIHLLAFRFASQIICITPQAQDYYHTKGIHQTTMIPNGIPIQSEYSSYKEPTSELVFLYVGRLSYEKGFDILLDALKKLPTNRAWRVEVVGGGPLEEACKRQAKALSLDQKITWHGFQEDVSPFLAESDVLVIPSRQESFGMVILEAWAHKTPVISTSSEGAEFLIKNNQNGRVVKLSADSLANALQEFIENPLAYQQYAQNGFEKVKAEYSVDRSFESLISVYANILSSTLHIK